MLGKRLVIEFIGAIDQRKQLEEKSEWVGTSPIYGDGRLLRGKAEGSQNRKKPCGKRARGSADHVTRNLATIPRQCTQQLGSG